MGHGLQMMVDIGQHIPGQKRAYCLCQCTLLGITGINAYNFIMLSVKAANGLRNAFYAVECRFNLSQLNAITHMLNLSILTGQEGQDTLLIHHSNITCTVDHIRIIWISRVGNKDILCFFRFMEVKRSFKYLS